MPPWHLVSLMHHRLDLTSHVPKVYYVILQERFTYAFSSLSPHLNLYPVHPNSHRHAPSQTRTGPPMKRTVKVSRDTVSSLWTPWYHGLHENNGQFLLPQLNQNIMR